MIKALINWSIQNRFMVIVLTIIVSGWGIYAVKNIPLDAIPDLSDVQVIIKTTYPGQAPQVVEDQVTGDTPLKKTYTIYSQGAVALAARGSTDATTVVLLKRFKVE